MNFGIICEFNPFHAGHKYLFDRARELGAKNIVCVMSGNAVQRGELAIVDKYSRAKIALENGADLVLELPFPWSSASAEFFASAGISALSPYCDAVIFGSECGDVELLSKAANRATEFDFMNNLANRINKGEGAAAAYFSLLEEHIGTKLSSNDNLGIEYIKAAILKNAGLDFYTVRRIGNAYRDNNIIEGKTPSASAIRQAIRDGASGEMLASLGYIDTAIQAAISEGAITDDRLLERAILLHFRLCNPSELSSYAESDGGIAERICTAARNNADFNGFWNDVKTKRYTDARLRRAMLFCLTRVRRELLLTKPEYLYLLAANENGRKLLSRVKKSNSENAITVVTKPADAPRDSEQFAVEERLNALFSIARKNSLCMGDAYRKNAFIIK